MRELNFSHGENRKNHSIQDWSATGNPIKIELWKNVIVQSVLQQADTTVLQYSLGQYCYYCGGSSKTISNTALVKSNRAKQYQVMDTQDQEVHLTSVSISDASLSPKNKKLSYQNHQQRKTVPKNIY